MLADTATAAAAAAPGLAGDMPLRRDLFEALWQEGGLRGAAATALAQRIGSPSALGERLVGGAAPFDARARLLDGLTARMAEGAPPPGVLGPPVAPTALDQAAMLAPSELTPQQAGHVRLMVAMFDFASEFALIHKAAGQFVGSVNQLMKGQ